MAYELITLPNTAPAAGANPFGDLIDDPAGIIGTPLNKQSLHDIFVFFQKMALEAGVVLNNLPENNTNTFQFYQALIGLWTNTGTVFTNSGANVWDNKGAPYGKFHYKKMGNEVFLSGVMKNSSGSSPITTNLMTLPAGIRPNYKTTVLAYANSPTPGIIQLDIATSGAVTSVTPCDDLLFLEGINYKLGLDSY